MKNRALNTLTLGGCVAILLLFGLVACQAPVTEILLPTETATTLSLASLASFTPIPTILLATSSPTETATLPASPIPASATVERQLTATLHPSLAPTNTNTPQASATTESIDLSHADEIPLEVSPTLPYNERYHAWLARPIAIQEGRTHWIDRTYPYGSTQLGAREVHLGVEFVNHRYTPVLAAASGQVLYAGTDADMQFGPALNYYGNLVVLAHDFATPVDFLPVYTLYAHLEDIAVETGQIIERGATLGRVGSSGVAIGAHLHFEVRVGDAYAYLNTRNPDLWLEPYQEHGILIGRVTGLEVFGLVLQVRSADVWRETYTYGSHIVNRDPLWGENFALGDLPVGEYEVILNGENGKIFARQTITIRADEATWLEFQIDS